MNNAERKARKRAGVKFTRKPKSKAAIAAPRYRRGLDVPRQRISWQSWTTFAVILGVGVVGLIFLAVAQHAAH